MLKSMSLWLFRLTHKREIFRANRHAVDPLRRDDWRAGAEATLRRLNLQILSD